MPATEEQTPVVSPMSEMTAPPTQNKKLVAWVEEIAALTQPASIYWCDGSAEEYDRLCQTLIDSGVVHLHPLAAKSAASPGRTREPSPLDVAPA